MPENHERTTTRREVDKECLDHEKKMEALQSDMEAISVDVHNNSGKFTSMLWFMGVVGAGISIGITVVISMLFSIQASLGTNNIAVAEDRKDIKAIREIEIPQIKKDITNIDDRHKWEDQNPRR